MSKSAVFMIEYAVAGGSVCPECKKSIYNGALRIGRSVVTGGRSVQTWYHAPHTFEAMARWRAGSRRIAALGDIEGVDAISSFDRRTIAGLIGEVEDVADAIGRLSLTEHKATREKKTAPPSRALVKWSPSPEPMPPSRALVKWSPSPEPMPLPKPQRSPLKRSVSESLSREQEPVPDYAGDRAPSHLSQSEREMWYESRRVKVHISHPISLLRRRFVTKAKFWEIDLDGTTATSNWGPIGETGQLLKKTFVTESEARAYVESKINEKKRKGYAALVTLDEVY